MKQINYIAITLLLSLGNIVQAQTSISRQVIGSSGGTQTGTNIILTSTVGEANIQSLFSIGGIILTQGFQQTMSGDSVLTYELINESCPGAANGSLYITNVNGCPGPYSLTIMDLSDSTFVGQDTLSSGDYDITVTGNNNCFYSTTIFIGLDSDVPCELIFYTGITPNGDGKNDTWIIENIEQFPDNDIKIFNRWGNVVWKATNYDNSTVVWEGLNKQGKEMADATYFYVAVVEGKTYKGWVELTR